MKAQKSFWQRHLAKVIGFVLVIALFGSLAVLRYNQKQQQIQEFGDKLTMFKQPPPDAAEGGHWHQDGTWHNEPHKGIIKIPAHKPETTDTSPNEPHPHDSLTDEEHAEVHGKEQEDREKALKYLAEMEKKAKEARARLDEAERAFAEQREFEKLIPNFQKQIVDVLEVGDYNFILTYPTPVQIIEKFSTPESLDAFCKRLLKYQSLIIEISDEINKRPAFAKRMQRKYPDFMENINKVKELEIPQLYAEGTK